MEKEVRLIDANAYPCQTCEVSYCYKNCEKFNAWFNKTVDAAEVKHGRWEKAHVSGYLKCNCCNDAFIYEEWLENGKWNYCPNCGAKLDGDGNEILEI